MGQLYSDIQLWEWPLRVQKEEHGLRNHTALRLITALTFTSFASQFSNFPFSKIAESNALKVGD